MQCDFLDVVTVCQSIAERVDSPTRSFSRYVYDCTELYRFLCPLGQSVQDSDQLLPVAPFCLFARTFIYHNSCITVVSVRPNLAERIIIMAISTIARLLLVAMLPVVFASGDVNTSKTLRGAEVRMLLASAKISRRLGFAATL